MPDLPNNSPKKETEAPDEKTEKQSSIRTMKSDIEELFKNTKPSLVQILSKEVSIASARAPAEKAGARRMLYFMRAAFVLAIFFIFAFVYVIFFGREGAVSLPKILAPAAYFATESSRTIAIREKDRQLFLRLMSDSAREFERPGTAKRIIIKIEKGEGEFAKTSDFFQLYRITPPGELSSLLESHIMPFFFYTDQGTRFGFAVRVRDSDRVLRDFIQWESLLPTVFRDFFFDEEPEKSVAPFEDRTYRNIDWRYIKLSQEKDLGLGYAIFPAKNVLVLATSKETMETVINRLFESR